MVKLSQFPTIYCLLNNYLFLQEISAYMYFRQYWKDPRVAKVLNSTVILIKEDINLMWRPDTYCYNSRYSDLDKEDKNMHSLFKVQPNGDIFYSRK